MCAQKSEQVDAVVARAQDYTPCLSFSRARDCRPGPPPLRSNSQPLGLPDLSEVDQPKVEVGNRPMRFTVRFMTACIFLRVSCCFENPATSRIWLCPPVRRLLRRRHVCSQRVDYFLEEANTLCRGTPQLGFSSAIRLSRQSPRALLSLTARALAPGRTEQSRTGAY